MSDSFKTKPLANLQNTQRLIERCMGRLEGAGPKEEAVLTILGLAVFAESFFFLSHYLSGENAPLPDEPSVFGDTDFRVSKDSGSDLISIVTPNQDQFGTVTALKEVFGALGLGYSDDADPVFNVSRADGAEDCLRVAMQLFERAHKVDEDSSVLECA